jgi:hypothetical protein
MTSGVGRRPDPRGTTANTWWLRTRIAGLNLRRLLNLGLTHTANGWALSTT